MPTVSVSVHRDDPEPEAYVLGKHSDDGPFITVGLGGVSIFVRGYGRESSASARRIAASLVKAADDVDAFMDAEDARAVAALAALEGGL